MASLTFKGTTAFTGTLGGPEARLTAATSAAGVATVLQIDKDGNGTVDMEVKLVGLTTTLSQADFV